MSDGGTFTKGKYEIPEAMRERLMKDFSYHPPKDDQVSRYEHIRGQAHWFACVISGNTPPSREQSLALTALEEAVMWANAAIARNE